MGNCRKLDSGDVLLILSVTMNAAWWSETDNPVLSLSVLWNKLVTGWGNSSFIEKLGRVGLWATRDLFVTRAARRHELLGISAVHVACVHPCCECSAFIVTFSHGAEFDKNVRIPYLLKYVYLRPRGSTLSCAVADIGTQNESNSRHYRLYWYLRTRREVKHKEDNYIYINF
jgi:hypothetical protein